MKNLNSNFAQWYYGIDRYYKQNSERRIKPLKTI